MRDVDDELVNNTGIYVNSLAQDTEVAPFKNFLEIDAVGLKSMPSFVI